jgi:uncharacterized protein (DUF2235 family)
MAKNIVLLSDGTGNTPEKNRGTNVWKVYLAIDRHDHEEDPRLPQQVAFYDDGVGTEGIRIIRLAGGAFGLGLSRNIRQLYTSLVLNYEPGDKVFLFGFSRGAFTVRSLAGMISRCGLLTREHYQGIENFKERDKLTKRILRAYRSEDKDAGKRIRDSLGLRQIQIAFIGVWDTVDAVGVPVDEVKLILDNAWRKIFGIRLWGFHDQVLSSKVRRGCQALAIDDERRTFHPNVWDPREGVEQVWFAGVHSNVGGGYPKEGLANVSLYWMILQAEKAGLRFLEDAKNRAHNQANAHSKLYDSRLGLAAYYRYKPRNIEALCGSDSALVHVTVLDRIRWFTDGYAPMNLPDKFLVVDPDASKKGKEGVRRRVNERQTSVDRSASKRAAERDKTNSLCRKRTILYFSFLLLNGALLLTLAALLWEWRRVTGLLLTLSHSLHPLLGWANPIIAFIIRSAAAVLSVTVGVVIPDFLAGPIQSLGNIPEVASLFILLFGLLFRLRKVLLRRMREHGEELWKCAFDNSDAS